MTSNLDHSFVNRNIIFHANDYFYEEINPDSSESLGGFKTSNPEGNRFQRQMIHVSSAKSRFKKTVELILCCHGWKNPDKKDPMTLIVLGVNLSCHDRSSRFQSVEIRLRFGEDDQRDPVDTVEACPQVVAYAPFVQEERWNTTAANVNDSREYGGRLGVNQFGDTEISASKKAEVSYMRKHFDRGSAYRLYDDRTGRIYGVEWYCEQNRLENYGVLPNSTWRFLLRDHTMGTGLFHSELNSICGLRLALDMIWNRVCAVLLGVRDQRTILSILILPKGNPMCTVLPEWVRNY
ncbi:hypothetical protein GGI35DRAFT_430747 [Trichoderma velutinum]